MTLHEHGQRKCIFLWQPQNVRNEIRAAAQAQAKSIGMQNVYTLTMGAA